MLTEEGAFCSRVAFIHCASPLSASNQWQRSSSPGNSAAAWDTSRQLVSLANGLRPAGHRIVVALRELSRAAGLLDNSGITVLQSPYKPPASQNSIATPRTFAHVLWNAGFGDPSELQVLTEAWGNLLDSVKPDLIVFDHAPTALLAARGDK